MRRREFIAGLVGVAAWPGVVLAQRKMPVVAYLTGGSSGGWFDAMTAEFRKGLGEAGYVDGKNVVLAYSIAGNRYDRLPALAAELVRRQVDVIFAAGIPAARAAKAATASIPIVFAFGEEPIKEGIADGFNRPGGNITGFSHFTNQLIGKRLELLKDMAPGAAALAFLVDANNPIAEPDAGDAQKAAVALGRRMEVLPVGNERDIETAFAT